MNCKICGNDKNNASYLVKEMLIGFGDEFEYLECSKCGCLQIIDVPENLAKYYPNDYYSFILTEKSKASRVKKFITTTVDNAHKYYYTKQGGFISKLFCLLFPELMPPIPPSLDLFSKKILDVGCGNGQLLVNLAKAGFKDLHGVDLFIEQDIKHNINGNYVNIKKGEIFDIEGIFDVIMLNHSLEHMPEQEEPIRKITELLKDDGICIICIPTVSGYPWKKYRENWFALDAPRHLFLHSLESITMLCKKFGLTIDKIVYNSFGNFQVSKYYAQGCNLEAAQKKLYSPFGLILLAFEKLRAKSLNRKRQGDGIAVYLRKPVKGGLNYDK